MGGRINLCDVTKSGALVNNSSVNDEVAMLLGATALALTAGVSVVIVLIG